MSAFLSEGMCVLFFFSTFGLGLSSANLARSVTGMMLGQPGSMGHGVWRASDVTSLGLITLYLIFIPCF